MPTQLEFFPDGKVYLEQYNTPGSVLRNLGQVPELKLSIETEVKNQANYQGGGGLSSTFTRIKGVKISTILTSFVKENMAIALYGTASVTAGDTKTNEVHTAYRGGLTELTGASFTAITAVVAPDAWVAGAVHAVGDVIKPITNPTHFYVCTTAGTSADPTEPTWNTDGTETTDGSCVWADGGLFALTSGTDFTTESAGLYFLESATRIPLTGDPITVTYTHAADNEIEAAVNTGLEYSLVWSATNAVNADKPMKLRIHRLKFTPMKDFGLIVSDYSNMALEGEVLKDDLITGDGLSKFFQVTMA